MIIILVRSIELIVDRDGQEMRTLYRYLNEWRLYVG